MQQTRLVTLYTDSLYVHSATEYNEVGSRAPKHPRVVLQTSQTTTGKTFDITNRYVLFNLLKRCDPTLRYDEFMQTVYDIPVGFEDRPSLKDIIKGYLENPIPLDGYENTRHNIDVQVIESRYMNHIVEVYDTNPYSSYFSTTYAFIGSNMLHDYTMMGVKTTKVDDISYPMMTFVKDTRMFTRTSNGVKNTPAQARFIINILSRRNKTTITGKVEYIDINDNGENACIQPDLAREIKGWAHTIEAGLLNITLSEVDEKLTRFCEEVKVTRRMLSTKTGSARLRDFYEKNKLEREYYHELLRESKLDLRQ